MNEARDTSEDAHCYGGRDLEALSDLPNYYGWIVQRFSPYLAGDGIEFGAGIGTVSIRIQAYLESLELVEPSPNLTMTLVKRFAAMEKVRVSETSLEARLASQADAAFDTAVMVNVLEHIEDDAAALADLHRILRPGGHLLIFVPALPFLYSAFDRLVGHFRRYRRRELLSLLGEARFKVVEVSYMDRLGVLPWWLVQTVGGRTDIDPRMASLYDRVGVPLTRGLEKVLPLPLGKNLIAIARRP